MAATLWHHKKVLYHTRHQPRKIKIQSSQLGVCQMLVTLNHHNKSVSEDPSVLLLSADPFSKVAHLKLEWTFPENKDAQDQRVSTQIMPFAFKTEENDPAQWYDLAFS